MRKRQNLQGACVMTTGRLGATAAPPNAAYAGQVVHFPDPLRAARYPQGVRVDEKGYPDFAPYAAAAAEIAEPPEGFGVDELRLTDYVSANAAQHRAGHKLFGGPSPVATPHGWTWHHVAGTRRMELVPVEVKALLRHHGGLATAAVRALAGIAVSEYGLIKLTAQTRLGNARSQTVLSRVGFRVVGERTVGGRPGTAYELMLEDGP